MNNSLQICSPSQQRDWSCMPPELLELIGNRLPLVDYISFRGVCRQWRMSARGRQEITKFSKDLCVLFYDINENDDRCYLYHHSHTEYCTVHLPQLRGATVVQSKFGWLMAHKNNGQFFLFNPLTLDMYYLPQHVVTENQVCSFTLDPTRSECAVFIVSRFKDTEFEISSWRLHDDDENRWTRRSVQVKSARMGTMIAVVLPCNCDSTCNYCDKMYIYDAKRYLVYNYKSHLVELENLRADMKNNFNKGVFGETEKKHNMNWYSRFRGEKGMVVSTSAFSASYSISSGKYCQSTKDDDDEDDDNNNVAKAKLRSVKRVWMEPVFGN